MVFLFRKNSGMILILSLWILSILASFALLIGVGVRQKITLVSRIEKRATVHLLAKKGIQIARAVLKNASGDKEFFDFRTREIVHNNEDIFKDISSDIGMVEVSYNNYDYGLDRPLVMYGLDDEEGKLNVNFASHDDLKGLFFQVAGISEDESEDLANAIIDWRNEDGQKIVGFYGDDYYSNLNFSYKAKHGSFEALEEVLLVKGMNPDVFNNVKDFITVYGEGLVNINTASKPILVALGITEEVASLVVSLRNGEDEIPATSDDLLFQDTGVSISGGVLSSLEPEQLAQIDRLYVDGKISTISNFFRIQSKAVLEHGKEKRFVDCIIRKEDARIMAWREY